MHKSGHKFRALKKEMEVIKYNFRISGKMSKMELSSLIQEEYGQTQETLAALNERAITVNFNV